MKRMTAFAVLALFLGGAAARAAGMDGLDQTAWKMRVTGIRRLLFWSSDQLSFQDGNFICEKCRARGFIPAPYAVTNPAELHWIATLTNAKGESLVWEGRLERSWMRGTYTLVKAGPDGAKKVVEWTAHLIRPKRAP